MATPHELYVEHVKGIAEARRSNSESFDKAILTLSSTGLALSVTFLNNVVPLKDASCILLVKIAWFLFFGAIVATLLSFRVAQFALTESRKNAEDYYLNDKEDAFERKSVSSILSTTLDWVSGVFFITAVFLIVIFVTSNLGG